MAPRGMEVGVSNALGLLCFALAMFIAAMPEAGSETVVIHHNDYRVAEQLGCVEVARTCRAKMKSAEVRKWVRREAHHAK